MNALVVKGDLLKAPDKYIVHQCNCVSEKSAHLSQAIFRAFPYANCYGPQRRIAPNELGTIDVRGNGIDKRFVINLFGQYFPGNVKYPNGTKDNTRLREEAFAKALTLIEAIPNLQTIAFPWRIGCGAAGGDWNKYLAMINDFADRVSLVAAVRIYDRD